MDLSRPPTDFSSFHKREVDKPERKTHSLLGLGSFDYVYVLLNASLEAEANISREVRDTLLRRLENISNEHRNNLKRTTDIIDKTVE